MNSRKDHIGGFLAMLLLALLTAVIFFQIKLADPGWRARYSPLDVMEGERVPASE